MMNPKKFPQESRVSAVGVHDSRIPMLVASLSGQGKPTYLFLLCDA